MQTVLIVALTPALWAQSPVPPDADVLTAQMRGFVAAMDSSKSIAAMPWDEYIVLLYERLQQREPTPREFAVLCGLHDQIGLTPSAALSMVLRGDLLCPSYEQIRAFLAGKASVPFVSDTHSREVARRLARLCETADWMESEPVPSVEQEVKQLEIEPDPPDIRYNVYFGYLHAHCGLSDGEGTPTEAYAHARDVGGLDFFALTDHGEFLLLWPWDDKYAQLRDAAEQANEPGRFAALYGFEWSNPLLGHINVINAEDFTDCLRDFSIPAVYRWLERRPEAFGRFNHPGDYDYTGQEFLHFRLFPKAVPQMIGIELWNESLGFDTYYYRGSWTEDASFLDVANRNGWQLGALGAQDNHSANWGTRNDFRTAVHAEELTREAIVDAYRHRRFYTTEDKDLYLDFRCAGFPMGSRVQDAPRQFRVTASDGSGDAFEEVRLYKNGMLFETRPVQGIVVDETFEDASADSNDYYYVIIRQTDDNDHNGHNDEAISSPIWTGATPVYESGPGCVGGFQRGGEGISPTSLGDMLSVLCVACLLARRTARRRGVLDGVLS
jgi:hypothetical protein